MNVGAVLHQSHAPSHHLASEAPSSKDTQLPLPLLCVRSGGCLGFPSLASS